MMGRFNFKLFFTAFIFLLQDIILAQSQSTENIKVHTKFLASDMLEGRGTGSKGIRLAAEYISIQFDAIGLSKFNQDSYYQEFPFPNQEGKEVNVIGMIKAAEKSDKYGHYKHPKKN